MTFLENLWLGVSVAMTLQNLALCLLGCVLGTLIGVLPGIGAAATVALLLPVTYTLDPTAAIIMLSGIYYGAQYGGSTTAILVNLPGEAGSIVTCIDGHQMAKNGRAGAALAIAAIGSLIAGCIGTLFLAVAAPALAAVALSFGTPEYFALMLLGLVCAVVLSHGDMVKAFGVMLLGLLMGLVGADVQTGALRYTFGIRELMDGINFVPVALAVFGIAEVIGNLDRGQSRSVLQSKIGKLLPTRAEFRAALPAILRGTGIGSILGILPGGGAMLSSFVSYMVEKRISKTPQRFGHGAIEGVAGPEAANNAGAQTSFIPLLTLGIPTNSVMALIMAALIMQGITPGPMVIERQPELFWGVVVSMFVGNIMLVIINLPMVGLWVKLLTVPYKYLFPFILVVCCLGTYSLNFLQLDIFIIVIFAALGYVLRKAGCEMAPFLLGFILGPFMEENLRRALVLSDGNVGVFLERPLSAGLLLAAFGLIAMTLVPALNKKREEAFQEED